MSNATPWPLVGIDDIDIASLVFMFEFTEDTACSIIIAPVMLPNEVERSRGEDAELACPPAGIFPPELELIPPLSIRRFKISCKPSRFL